VRPGGSVALIGGRYELVAERGGDQDVVEWEGFDSALERRVRVRLLRQELVDDPEAVERFWTNARTQARGTTRTGERILDGGTDPETGRVYIVREWSADTPTRSHPAELAPRSSRWQPGRPTFVAVLLVAGVACVLVLRSGVQGWLAWVNEPLGQVNRTFALPPATTPRPAPSVATTQAAAATAKPTVAPTPRATPTATVAGVARRVVNTNGRGVALRAAPDGDRLPGKGYDEGAAVMAFETVGQWTRIRGGDGREGWVLSVTLGPVT
jgi:hypothetical protein